MKDVRQVDPLDALTAAVGGRRLFAMLWISWLLIAVLAHYAQDFPRAETVRPRSQYVFEMLAAVFLAHLVLFVRSLLSREKRKSLLRKRPDLPVPVPLLRIAVWLIPILALGAVLAPHVIK